ncbi:MAG: DUF3298 and DUF4163 domain-containing protein [Tannerella sp.]|jgi:hypothetical protein|nr:DUF3298 and DUF4163 domain-containing protein [Tannerella sp.]
MNTKVKIIATVLLSGIMITGCKQKATINPEAENDIKFDSILVNKTYYLLGDTTNPFCSLESTFIYPSDYKNKEVLNKVSRHFINSFFGEDTASVTPQEAMNKYVQKYIEDYKELESDFITETKITGEKPSQESWYAYYEMSSNEILFNRCNLLSYTVSVEYYTGGAHGGHGYNNHVLYLKNGEELEEEDLFIDNYQDDLSQIIVAAIASDNSVSAPEELENMGYFNIKEIYPNNNFHIDGEGITYTFNEFEIAAYFVGRIDVFLSFDKIRHLIREDSPVAPLVFTIK